MAGLGCALALLLASPSHAQERLSDRGRVLIAGQLSGYWQNHDRWQVAIEPSASWFFRDRFAIGGYLAYRDGKAGPQLQGATYEVGVQSVNEWALDEHLGLFFIVKAGYARHDLDGSAAPAAFATPSAQQPNDNLSTRSPFSPLIAGRDALHVELSIPLTYHLNQHVGIGIGPRLSVDFYPKPSHTDVQLGAATWLATSF
jgi:hypothetical protein